MATHRRQTVFGFGLFVSSLAMGAVGFQRMTHNHDWTESFLNAAMLLSGMGPVGLENELAAAKIFAAIYALYCGLMFVAVIALVFTPFAKWVIRNIDHGGLFHHGPPMQTPKQAV
jgi:hypothetical protein